MKISDFFVPIGKILLTFDFVEYDDPASCIESCSNYVDEALDDCPLFSHTILANDNFSSDHSKRFDGTCISWCKAHDFMFRGVHSVKFPKN